MRRVLVVNADDYGLSPGVDRGIREAAGRGIVTSVSVLATRADRDSVRALEDAAPGIGLGLHVDLTADLVRASPGDVARRVAEQFARFVEIAGRPPDHLDTHKHTHRRDAGALAVLASYGLPVRANDAAVRRTLRAAGAPCTDHFAGDVGPRPWWTLRRLRAALRGLPPGTTEIMCHPGLGDDLPAPLTYRRQRETELRTFTAPGLRARIRDLGIVLDSFAALR